MGEFVEEVHTYWRSQMVQGSIIHLDEVFTLVSNPALDELYKVMILEMTNKHTMAVVTPMVAEVLKLRELEEYSINALREAISTCKLELHSPDYIYYLVDNKVPQIISSVDGIVIRPLFIETDKEAFRQFESVCSEEDLDGAYVSLKHWIVYGAFDGDRLVGAVSVYPWEETKLADIGVITDDAYRGRRIATRLVQAICLEVIDRGHVPQYRCQTDNDTSIALAKAVGFTLFGQWEALVAD
ncbi:GNAT family N-acetyltransferase [Myroides odoratimimus]|uniref:GNAT family N-acetyltransferase n=1 Tax=Myroides odoratimimus TaxID=76832 RepID=UPI002576EC18|nr:GNAT family N-acetyltransferase [Myroides odoratimimus]MDM1396811.1 GNAT family N-acetyltransferase [Myroides odoratimimus]